MNAGAEQLAGLCGDYGAKAKVAAALGADQSLLTRWLAGERKPSGKYRTALKKLFEIPHEAWDEPANAEGDAA